MFAKYDFTKYHSDNIVQLILVQILKMITISRFFK